MTVTPEPESNRAPQTDADSPAARLALITLALAACAGLAWYLAAERDAAPQNQRLAHCRETLLQAHRDNTWKITRSFASNNIASIDWEARGFIANGSCHFLAAEGTEIRLLILEAPGQPRKVIQGHDLEILQLRARR